MSTIQITKNWHPEPKAILVESNPVQEGKKLSSNLEFKSNQNVTWEDLRGLSWVLFDEI